MAVGVFAAGLSGCVLFGCAREHRTYGAANAKQHPIPLPKQTLLQPQQEPGCTSDTPGSSGGLPGREGQLPRPADAPTRVANLAVDGSDKSGPQPGSLPVQADANPGTNASPNVSPNVSLAQRIKLEYERDCFRRAEARVRYRLLRLQVAVGATVKAVKRAEQTVP